MQGSILNLGCCTISDARCQRRCTIKLRRAAARCRKRLGSRQRPQARRCWHLQPRTVSRPTARCAGEVRQPHQGADSGAAIGGPSRSAVAARPKTKPWLTNALTREAVSPDLDWLIDRLAALNPAGANEHPDVVSNHAHEIRGRWWSWRSRDGNYAIRITGDVRPRAKPIPADAGTPRNWNGC